MIDLCGSIRSQKEYKGIRVPIVLSTNNAFALSCYITIFSIIEHTNKANFYDIKILETELTDENKSLLCSQSRDGIKIECINIKRVVSEIDLRGTESLPVEAYYRLFIPTVLSSYDKVIYLDSDTLVQRDIALLYSIDVGEYTIAAANEPHCKNVAFHEEQIGLDKEICSFNSGVIIINTNRFEEEHVRDRALQLLQEDYLREERCYTLLDQDVLNILLAKDAMRLDQRWNFLWRYLWEDDFIDAESKNCYMNIAKDPYIIHYSGSEKPWQNPIRPLADRYWDAIIRTHIFIDFLSQELERNRKKYENCLREITEIEMKRKLLDKYLFPYWKIPYGRRIVLYGAGRLGETIYELLDSTNYAESVIWTDSYITNNKHYKQLHPIKEIIEKRVGDEYYLIAIGKQEIADLIKKELFAMGVSKDRIIWIGEKEK